MKPREIVPRPSEHDRIPTTRMKRRKESYTHNIAEEKPTIPFVVDVLLFFDGARMVEFGGGRIKLIICVCVCARVQKLKEF